MGNSRSSCSQGGRGGRVHDPSDDYERRKQMFRDAERRRQEEEMQDEHHLRPAAHDFETTDQSYHDEGEAHSPQMDMLQTSHLRTDTAEPKLRRRTSDESPKRRRQANEMSNDSLQQDEHHVRPATQDVETTDHEEVEAHSPQKNMLLTSHLSTDTTTTEPKLGCRTSDETPNHSAAFASFQGQILVAEETEGFAKQVVEHEPEKQHLQELICHDDPTQRQPLPVARAEIEHVDKAEIFKKMLEKTIKDADDAVALNSTTYDDLKSQHAQINPIHKQVPAQHQSHHTTPSTTCPQAKVIRDDSEDEDCDPTLVHFSAFAPPTVDAGDSFTLNVHAYMKVEHAAVVRDEAEIGNDEAGINGPFRVQIGQAIRIVADGLPDGLSTQDHDATIMWEGKRAKCSFWIMCSKKIKVATCKCKANIFVNQHRVGVLCFTINTIPKLPFYKSLFKALVVKPSTRHKVNPVAKLVAETDNNIGATVTILPFKNSPHIFLSYRRSHADLADRIRLTLMHDYGYECFMDLDSEAGLGAGNFQNQLEDALGNCKIMIPIFTPAPSGADEVRKNLSSLACMKEYDKRGETDWCQVEISKALSDQNKIIIPVAKGIDLGAELKDLPDALAPLAALNARMLHDDMFPQSVDVVHNLIQREMQKLIRSGAI